MSKNNQKLENQTYRQTLITDYFKNEKKHEDNVDNNNNFNIITGYSQENSYNTYNSDSNHCLECGIDMGPSNPRQLCGKWRCYSK